MFRIQEWCSFAYRYIASGRIDVVHAVEDELQRTSLRTDDQVDAGEIIFKSLFKLMVEQRQESNQADAQCKEQYTHDAVEGFGEDVFPA